MTIDVHIAGQQADRQELLKALHEVITKNDKTVTASVGTMMGKEMILYHAPGTFKYGLASVKSHLSLHVLPIYGSAPLHEKYEKLLPLAAFQKGCINFKNADEMPLDIATALISDCAIIDLRKVREAYLAAKKKK
jgi:hypothetical protein